MPHSPGPTQGVSWRIGLGVSEMLGNADVGITLSSYAHVLPDMQDVLPTLWTTL